MPNSFCIPVVLAEKLKAAAQRKEFTIESLNDMTSSQRRELFEKYVDKEVAKQVNVGFEKAQVSKDQQALGKWVKNTFTGGEVAKTKQKDIFNKINELKDQGTLTPETEKAFLQDLVADKLGINITSEEGQEIAKRAMHLEEIAAKTERIGDSSGDQKQQLEYFTAKREMENYLDSLTPAGKLKIITSTISRGNMLWRIGSMLVNINSNNLEGAIGAVVRRIGERSIVGSNGSYVRDQAKFHLKVYLKTGYDLTRMTSLDSDRKVLGEGQASAQGEGLIRKIGRFYEDKIFGITQGAPDVAMASLAGGDRGDLMSTRIARAEGLRGEAVQKRALEIFKDASLVEPETKEGKLVKSAMVADAERSTNTDKRILAEKALALRKVLNVGDLRFGDMNIPFVKTTANSIQSALELSGVTVPIEVPLRLLKMIKLVSETNGGEGVKGFVHNAGNKEAWGEASKEAWKDFGNTMVRAGLGFTAAWLLANAIKSEDYIGVYPTSAKERELMELKNAVPNSVRIGNKWYSLDWLGPLAAPIIGHMNAKKYGHDLPSYAYAYATGAGYQVLRTPGIDYLNQSITGLTKTLSSASTNTPKQAASDLGNYLVDFASSRAVPGFVSDIANLTDDVVRDTSRKNDILAPLKNKFPGLRETLPENKDVFGNTTKTEGWVGLLFGSRVKTVKDNPAVVELTRLSSTGNLPSITDVSKTSERAKALKEQIGSEKFDTAMQQFGERFHTSLENLIQKPGYQKLSDEKKSEAITNMKAKEFDAMLLHYHYRKPPPKK